MPQLSMYRVWSSHIDDRVYFAETMEQVVNDIDENEDIDRILKECADVRILGWDDEQELVDSGTEKIAGD